MKISYIFDWDGVVVDSSQQHEESWERLAAAERLNLPEGHFKKGFGKKNEWIIPNLLGWAQDAEEIGRLGRLKEERYRAIVRETGLSPLPGVRSFVADLDAAGAKRAVGSSTPRENIETVLEIAGLEGLFDVIVAAADVKHGKPDPEVFLKAAERMGARPENCVVFEDSFGGIDAGKAARMKVVGLATTNPLEDLLDAGVDLAVDSFEELSIERIGRLW